jgi:16S rRNA C967 or C1407 C5-methylase (RsmB/RsmF family)/NOL1/NOP2/fmu family ribosome biogenesis protein
MSYHHHLSAIFGPDIAQQLLESLNETPKQALRINPFKITTEWWEMRFPFHQRHPIVSNGFLLHDHSPAFGKHPYHAAGLYYLQEPSAMTVGELLPLKPNDWVLDLCAAPGGKTTHVATRLGPKGRLIANDRTYARAQSLSENVERFGLANTVVTSVESKDLAIRFPETFDKIILDAPCSGEGMFRKNPLAEADWSLDKVAYCANLQTNLIADAFKMLKPGGLLLYSTCTFSKQENEEQILQALATFDCHLLTLPDIQGGDRGIHMPEAIRLLPIHFPGEGHFIALLQKNGNHSEEKRQYASRSRFSQASYVRWQTFANETLKKNPFLATDLFQQGDQLYAYALPPDLFQGLRTLRNGIHLGEIREKYFVPQHALALAMHPDQAKNTINLEASHADVARYLRGEPLASTMQGYTLVCIDGNTLGWAKGSNGVLKNHYPKGLRRP